MALITQVIDPNRGPVDKPDEPESNDNVGLGKGLLLCALFGFAIIGILATIKTSADAYGEWQASREYAEYEDLDQYSFTVQIPPLASSSSSYWVIGEAGADTIDAFTYVQHPDTGEWILKVIDYSDVALETDTCLYTFAGVGLYAWPTDDGGCDPRDGYKDNPEMPRIIPETM